MLHSTRPVTLLFPPLCEALLFPYLSLPFLTSWLRRNGVVVDQRDLNLQLAHRLFCSGVLGAYRCTRNGDDLPSRYRATLAGYLEANCCELTQKVYGKSGGTSEDARLVRAGHDMLCENSFLAQPFTSLAQLVSAVAQFEAPESGDLASRSLWELIEELAPGENGIVGISVAFYSQLTSALLVAKYLKQRNPKLVVVLGGPQLSLHGEDLLALPDVASWVDVICTGPGEDTLLALATRSAEADPRECLPHAYWTCSPELSPIRTEYDFQSLAPPDFDGLPIRQYLNPEYHLATTTCVGCSWGRCAYCSYGNRSLSQKSYRQASPAQLADWCEFLSEKHGGRRINFVDENTNLRLVMSAMRILNERGVRIRFSTRNRFEKVLLDRAFCAELAERGCVLMSMGYDTNSQRLLNLLDRGVSAEHYQPIIDNLNAVGIVPGLSVMGGLPGETEAEVSASEAFLEKNASKIGIDVMQMLVLEKKTLMHEAPGDYELSVDSSDQLRGNALLNYGMGRMGRRFDYRDQSSFEQRERRFAQMHQKVHPQKDVDLPPDHRLASAPANDMPRDRLLAAKLQPWVRVIRDDGVSRSLILADLIWQRVFELRGARVENDGSLLPVEGAAHLHSGIWALVEQGRALPEWSQAC